MLSKGDIAKENVNITAGIYWITGRTGRTNLTCQNL